MVREREGPFDFFLGGGGQEDVCRPGYIFRPVFLFANNTNHIVELFLSCILFLGKLGPEFFYEKSSCPPIKFKWSLPKPVALL